MGEIKTLQWKENKLVLINCTKLPEKEEYFVCNNYLDLEYAIKNLIVRGAPAIGVAAAYGVVLAYKNAIDKGLKSKEAIDFTYEAIEILSETRPTAVNLFWALNIMKDLLESLDREYEHEVFNILLNKANEIHENDLDINKAIGKYGREIVPKGGNILTHCNAGALATSGYGTALGVVRAARDKNIHLYIDETRPLLQGSRLTAWEIEKEDIACTLISDNMAGYLMQLGKVDLLIFGADRIARNGDVANKIGSYSISILAKYHNIPVYVAAPKSTIDINLESGDDIPIEERKQEELKYYKNIQTAPKSVNVFNPAFDVTPNELITGIITEEGILEPPYEENIEKLFAI